MSTGTTWQIESSSSGDTFAIGERLGRKCKGGEIFVLQSDLGGGKTTFTQGLASGLGCQEAVTSPTFTISRVYTCKNSIELHHYDFYRLQEAGVIAYELEEMIIEPHVVIAIEWGDIIQELLPEHAVVIRIDRTAQDEEHRIITFTSKLSNQLLEDDKRVA